jgi:hypothetical protein
MRRWGGLGSVGLLSAARRRRKRERERRKDLGQIRPGERKKKGKEPFSFLYFLSIFYFQNFAQFEFTQEFKTSL